MKYKSGEDPKPGDIIRNPANGKCYKVDSICKMEGVEYLLLQKRDARFAEAFELVGNEEPASDAPKHCETCLHYHNWRGMDVDCTCTCHKPDPHRCACRQFEAHEHFGFAEHPGHDFQVCHKPETPKEPTPIPLHQTWDLRVCLWCGLRKEFWKTMERCAGHKVGDPIPPWPPEPAPQEPDACKHGSRRLSRDPEEWHTAPQEPTIEVGDRVRIKAWGLVSGEQRYGIVTGTTQNSVKFIPEHLVQAPKELRLELTISPEGLELVSKAVKEEPIIEVGDTVRVIDTMRIYGGRTFEVQSITFGSTGSKYVSGTFVSGSSVLFLLEHVSLVSKAKPEPKCQFSFVVNPETNLIGICTLLRREHHKSMNHTFQPEPEPPTVES